jgi:hypothetical protein
MKRGVAFIVIIFLPALLCAQEYAAGASRKGIYHRTGTVIGGTITDGKDVCEIVWSKHRGIEGIMLSICEGSMEEKTAADEPCYFTVVHEEYPHRLVFTLSGVRLFSADIPCLDESDLIGDMHRIIYLDDSGVRFAVTLKRIVEFEVIERHDPAIIEVLFRPVAEVPVYSLRSESMRANEGLGHLEERIMRFGGSKVRIIKSQNELYFVEEGYYDTAAEAERRGRFFSKNGVELMVEERMPLTVPVDLKRRAK